MRLPNKTTIIFYFFLEVRYQGDLGTRRRKSICTPKPRLIYDALYYELGLTYDKSCKLTSPEGDTWWRFSVLLCIKNPPTISDRGEKYNEMNTQTSSY